MFISGYANTENVFYCLNIAQPTRVTDRSATLIDNIFANTFNFNALSGNLVTKISDHFPQFLMVQDLKVYQWSCRLLPPCFSEYFKFTSSFHSYWTRQSCNWNLHVSSVNTSQYGLRSLKFTGPRLWNSLPTITNYLDDPNSLSILLLPFFLYSLVVLCLDAYVNLTFMSCKTELSLINHLVLYHWCKGEIVEVLAYYLGGFHYP